MLTKTHHRRGLGSPATGGAWVKSIATLLSLSMLSIPCVSTGAWPASWTLSPGTVPERGQLADIGSSGDGQGWICGWEGATAESQTLLLRTEDGGASWEKGEARRGSALYECELTSPAGGYAVGWDEGMAAVWRVEGRSLTELVRYTPGFMNRIEVLDDGTLWVTGQGEIGGELRGFALSSSDGGVTWTEHAALRTTIHGYWSDIFFDAGGVGYLT